MHKKLFFSHFVHLEKFSKFAKNEVKVGLLIAPRNVLAAPHSVLAAPRGVPAALHGVLALQDTHGNSSGGGGTINEKILWSRIA